MAAASQTPGNDRNCTHPRCPQPSKAASSPASTAGPATSGTDAASPATMCAACARTCNDPSCLAPFCVAPHKQATSVVYFFPPRLRSGRVPETFRFHMSRELHANLVASPLGRMTIRPTKLAADDLDQTHRRTWGRESSARAKLDFGHTASYIRSLLSPPAAAQRQGSRDVQVSYEPGTA